MYSKHERVSKGLFVALNSSNLLTEINIVKDVCSEEALFH